MIDIIIIAIIVLSIFLGYRKGLVKMALNICAFFAALIITLVLYQPISNFVIEHTELDEKLQNTILQNANSAIEENKQVSENEQIQNTADQITNQVQNEILPETAQNISKNVIQLGVIIILYLLVKIVLSVVIMVADKIADLPILHQFNKIGGIAIGAIRGILIVYVAIYAIHFVGEVYPTNSVSGMVEKSYIGKAMDENNVLSLLVK